MYLEHLIIQKGVFHIETPLEQQLSIQSFKVGEDSLSHELKEWHGVGWQEVDLNEFKFLKEVFLKTRKMSRCIVKRQTST